MGTDDPSSLVWMKQTGGALLAQTTVTLASVDILNGHRGPVVAVRSDLASAVGGAAPDVGENAGFEHLVITTNGHYAWLDSGRQATPGGPPLDALYIPDGHRGDRRIDSGPYMSLGHLRARDTRISWTNQGISKTAQLR
jgi:hypothetical protein